MAKIAIIETGGKQYVVAQDSVINVEKIGAEERDGSKLTFKKVLLTDDGSATNVGAPYLDGATVAAEVVEDGRNKRITVIKYKQKSRYFKKRGHKQPYTKVRIVAL